MPKLERERGRKKQQKEKKICHQLVHSPGIPIGPSWAGARIRTRGLHLFFHMAGRREYFGASLASFPVPSAGIHMGNTAAGIRLKLVPLAIASCGSFNHQVINWNNYAVVLTEIESEDLRVKNNFKIFRILKSSHDVTLESMVN